MAFLSLPKEQKELYAQIGYREKLEAVDEGIRRRVELERIHQSSGLMSSGTPSLSMR